jgi:succinoglycan biosynthesis transport protein ExoP
LDVGRQLRIVWRWLPLIVVSVVLAGVAAFYVSGLQPKTYEATTTLIVGQSLSGVNPDYNQLLVSQSLSKTYATVTTTRPVLTRVITKLGLPDAVDDLAKRVTATAATDATLITITGRDGSPAGAAALANAVAEELIAASPSVQGQQTDVLQSVDEDLRAIRDQIEATQTESDRLSNIPNRTAAQETQLQTLQGRVVSLRATYATLLAFSTNNSSNLLSIVEPAVSPTEPASPRPLLNALFAAIIAFLVAAAIVFAAEYLDDSIKDAEQVLEATGLPTLGAIARLKGAKDRPEMYRLVTLLYPRSPAAEAFRTLRTNIEFASVDAPIKTLLVTSAVPLEGKTVTAANLAVVFAQGGRRVLLVDADLRRPAAERMFALPNPYGLTTMLRGGDTMVESMVESMVQATEQENLYVLSTGPLPPNPAEVLASQRMRAVLHSLGERFDLLLFDSPPLDVFADAAVLSSFLDGTILVVDGTRNRRKVVRQAREALAKANAKVLGAVLNRLPEQTSHYYDNYGDYTHDEGTESRSRGTEPAPKESTS